MTTQKTIELSFGEEVIEDRAVAGSVIEHNWNSSSTPPLHSEEPYERVLVVVEMGKKP